MFRGCFVVRVPPIAAAAGERRFVNNPKPAADAEELDPVFRFQVPHDRHDFLDRIRERRKLSNLRTDVHLDRKSTRLNSSHTVISYAVFCLKKKKSTIT